MTRVYRLHVAYPPEPSQIPDHWIDDNDDGDGRFRWPRERQFLSYSAAKRRKDLLESMGCTVTMERSAPVEWDLIIYNERAVQDLLDVLNAGGPGRT